MKGIALFAEGEQVSHFALIKSASKGVTSGGKPFLTLIIQDKSGDIEAKLWDASPQDEAEYVPNAIVKVDGDVTSFRGKAQLRIRSLRLATSSDPVKKSDLVMTAPLEIEAMMETMTQYIFEIKNANIQRITRALLKKHQEAFFEYPAAVRNHHEYLSGLSYHVVSMLHLAKSVSALYPSLDTDLLYAGIILHDMGKVTELSGATAASYTLEGKLLGHITIMVSEIAETAKEIGVDGEEVLLLQHMVLSHHSKPEWGSPIPPLVKEAEILHMLDNLDAKMNMMNRSLDKTKPGEFTDRLFALDQRSFYQPKLSRIEEESLK